MHIYKNYISFSIIQQLLIFIITASYNFLHLLTVAYNSLQLLICLSSLYTTLTIAYNFLLPYIFLQLIVAYYREIEQGLKPAYSFLHLFITYIQLL